MLDFTFNGVKASDMGIKVMDIRHTVMPAIQDRYETVPGRDGSYLFAQAYGDRIISIDCLVLSTDYKKTRQDIIPISARLNTKDRERLELNDLPDKYLMAKLTNGGELNRFLYTGTFTLEFNCEPFLYSDILIYSTAMSSPFTRNSEAYNIDYTLVNSNIPRFWSLGTKLPVSEDEQLTVGTVWPLANNLSYITYDGGENIIVYGGSGTATIYVGGTVETYPIISVKGTNTSGQISITLNGTTFSYTGALVAVDTVVVDCQKFSCKKNGARDMVHFIGDWPVLQTGDNVLTYSTSGGATITELKITVQSRWL